jgi:hypothetical protein
MMEQAAMADQVCVPGLDLGQALQTVAREGFAFVPRALAEDFRRALQQEVQACPFQPVPGEIGPVRQETEECVIPSPMDGYPLVARLSGELLALVRDHGRAVAGLEAWVPTAAFVQRYRPGALGITAHLDCGRFGLLVAVFTSKGSARFSIHDTRSGPVVARWEAAPGSLVLLRAPGLAGVDDGRPFHTVGGPPDQGRYSVSFRMDTRQA